MSKNFCRSTPQPKNSKIPFLWILWKKRFWFQFTFDEWSPDQHQTIDPRTYMYNFYTMFQLNYSSFHNNYRRKIEHRMQKIRDPLRKTALSTFQSTWRPNEIPEKYTILTTPRLYLCIRTTQTHTHTQTHTSQRSQSRSIRKGESDCRQRESFKPAPMITTVRAATKRVVTHTWRLATTE